MCIIFFEVKGGIVCTPPRTMGGVGRFFKYVLMGGLEILKFLGGVNPNGGGDFSWGGLEISKNFRLRRAILISSEHIFSKFSPAAGFFSISKH